MHGEVVGAIALGWRRAVQLGVRDRDVLMHIGFGIAIAVEHDSREFESTRDGLTGLKNRRAFDLRFPKLLEACHGSKSPLSLVVFDLDNFKRCNDRHGHAVGDGVLQGTAKKMTEHMLIEREDAYRVGGEEFAVLMPSTSAAQALPVMQRVCAAVSAQVYVGRDDEKFNVTLSVGIAEYDGNAREALHSFYERADRAMYRAKTTGKDRIVVSEDG
jgi:diguanylate cyclase (GGDEF)-like protein